MGRAGARLVVPCRRGKKGVCRLRCKWFTRIVIVLEAQRLSLRCDRINMRLGVLDGDLEAKRQFVDGARWGVAKRLERGLHHRQKHVNPLIGFALGHAKQAPVDDLQ